jgi:hypothetical protein
MAKDKTKNSYFIKPFNQMSMPELIIQTVFNLVATFVLVSVAIDTASMWIYLLAIIFVVFLIISSTNLVKKILNKDAKAGRPKNT